MSKKQEKEIKEILTYEVQILAEEELQIVRVKCSQLDMMDCGDVVFSNKDNVITAVFSSSVLVAFYLLDDETLCPISVTELDREDEEEIDFTEGT